MAELRNISTQQVDNYLLITAYFMGWTKIMIDTTLNGPSRYEAGIQSPARTQKLRVPSELYFLGYHNSWEKLMPVIERCKNIMLEVNDVTAKDFMDKVLESLVTLHKQNTFEAVARFIINYERINHLTKQKS